jgi:predicted amidohydrolase
MPEERNASIEANLQRARELLDGAGKQKVDLVCLPELFALIGLDIDGESMAEGIEGPSMQIASRHAEMYQMYVVCPFLRRVSNGIIHNSAALIDRSGKVLGCYDKVYPWWPEFIDTTEGKSWGVNVGKEPKVFTTDFGPVGIQICFDANFPKPWHELRKSGAQIVFFPSAFAGGKRLQARAIDNNYYIVASTWTNINLVIDITGDVIGETGQHSLATHILDLDRQILHVDFQADRIRDLLETFKDKITAQWYPRENWVVLESQADDFSVTELVAEQGLETLWDYIHRSQTAIDGMRVRVPSTDSLP